MSEPKTGDELDLYVDGVRVATMQSASLDERLGTVQVASTNQYGADESEPGSTSWSASAQRLFVMGDSPSERAEAHGIIKSALRERREIQVVVLRLDGGTDLGRAWVTRARQQWGYKSLYRGSYKLKGNGPLQEDVTGYLVAQRDGRLVTLTTTGVADYEVLSEEQVTYKGVTFHYVRLRLTPEITASGQLRHLRDDLYILTLAQPSN